MPDSGDDAAMASVNAAVEVLRLAMLHGRGRRSGGGRGARGGAERAAEAESALAQAYDEMDGKPVSQDFEAGDPGNVVFGVETVEWDPSCEIVAGNLEELGVPFAKTVEGETAWFEIAGENAFAARALIDGLCEHVRGFGYDRISNYEGLAGSGAPAPAFATGAARQTGRTAVPSPAPSPAVGKGGSLRIEIREIASDPGCGLVAKELEARGVPYSRAVAGGVAAFVVPSASAAAAKGAIDSVRAKTYEYEYASINGYESLAEAAAHAPAAKKAADAVWRGVCATPEEAALVHAALAAHGIEHCGQVDPDTGAEEIFIAQSELDAKGYRIPRAIREMPGMPERLAALERGAQTQGSRSLFSAARDKVRGLAARFRPAEKLDRDLAAARAQAAAQAKDRAVPKVTRTRKV